METDIEKIELAVDGVYFTNVKDLVKITKIDEERNELHLYNITDSCKQTVKLSTHRLIRKVR